MPPRVYLAGPEVFHPDAVALGAAKQELCRAHGFIGLYPLDAAAVGSDAIYRGCLAMMADADLGIFNLTPFRGPSADVGTAFELGAMTAAGKPVFAYSNVVGDLLGRLRDEPGVRFDEAGRCWRDRAGMMIEDFGVADNLMLGEAVAASGGSVHRRAAAPDQRYTDLAAFVCCLRDAQAVLAGRGSPADGPARPGPVINIDR